MGKDKWLQREEGLNNRRREKRWFPSAWLGNSLESFDHKAFLRGNSNNTCSGSLNKSVWGRECWGGPPNDPLGMTVDLNGVQLGRQIFSPWSWRDTASRTRGTNRAVGEVAGQKGRARKSVCCSRTQE